MAGSGGQTQTAARVPATSGTSPVTPTATNEPVTSTPEPAAYEPRPSDFKLTVKTLRKACFGSAGCNVDYRIQVAYTGQPLDPSREYEVVYEVRGGEEPQINTLTVSGGQSSVQSEESIGTKSSKAKLTAVVTDVLSPSS